jgi:hypothetical protein
MVLLYGKLSHFDCGRALCARQSRCAVLCYGTASATGADDMRFSAGNRVG